MLRERINADLKEALRACNERRTSTLRLILAAMKERDIAARSEGNYAGIDDPEIQSMLQKMIKQRQQSIQLYEQGGRPDLADQEKMEIGIIQEYLPKPLTDEELRQELTNIIKDIKAEGLKDMKRVIETLKSRCGDRVDFAKASPLIRDLLSK